MLTENKFGKYLTYAIGEIFLVVIGILIALQINNWNEQRKKTILKNEYKTSLKIDLTKDVLQLNKKLKKNNETLNDIISAKESINNNINTLADYERLFRNLPEASNTINTYNTNTFNILISSGNIDLFDSQFREQVMELNRLQQNENSISSFNREIFFNVIENTLFKYPVQDNSFSKELLNALWKQQKKDNLLKDIISYLWQSEFTINRYIVTTTEVLKQNELILEQLK